MNGAKNRISKVASFRLGWLVALTLVAGTLSARAWIMPIENEGRQERPGQSNQNKSTKPEKSKNDPEPSVQIAWHADVWHGATDRPLVERSTATGDHVPAARSAQAESRPPVSASFARLETPVERRPSERYRIICRHAHAPPVAA